MIRLLLIAVAVLASPLPIFADELAECRRLAPKYKAKLEVRLFDGTRVDLLNDEYAIEVDYAKSGKHFEAVGQSLYYAIVTGKKPGIILLVRDKSDLRFAYRTLVVAAKHGIRVWIEDAKN